MNCKEFEKRTAPILLQADNSGDGYFVVFISRSEDTTIIAAELDSGDALVIIQELINRFGIEPDVLAKMQAGPRGFDSDIPGLGRVHLPKI